MYQPTYAQFSSYAKDFPVVPVYVTFSEDLLTPISIILKLSQLNPCYLLESVEGDEHLARYSIIGLGCRRALSSRDLSLSQLEQAMSQSKGPKLPELPPFYGGLVGYFSYDFCSELHGLKLKDEPQGETFQLLEAETVVIFDHLLHRLTVVYNTNLADFQEDYEAAYQFAQTKLRQVFKTLNQPNKLQEHGQPKVGQLPLEFSSNTTKAEFMAKVERAKEYIVEGDIFQVVLSQRFTAHGAVDSLGLYRNLRQQNPSPYLFYLQFPGLALVGSSPEMLVKTEGHKVETVPIAGTRPVLYDGQDQARATELLSDTKELAEHLMLLDLGRNDLGKVSQPGTVTVKDYCQVKHFSRVMHLVSRVEGELRPGLSPLEPLKATFPAGTLSGAPKLRAMEIITELEPENRGIYAGAVAYLSYTGNINSCITIRTFVVNQEQETVTIQAGAGIVADSEPEAEYQETLNKARALFLAAMGKDLKEVPYAVND